MLGGMPLIGETEAPRVLRGRRCSRWKASITVRAKMTQEPSHWCLIWPMLSSMSAFQLCGLGQHTSTFQEDFAGAVPLL